MANRVNTHISDLFFNRDLEACNVYDEKRVWTGYNHASFLGEAQQTILNLEALGVACPTPEELVADFLERV